MDTLIRYDKPDMEVIAYLSDPDGKEISLEIGTEVYYETDDMSDDEIIDWANDNGYLDDEEEDYMNEDGTPDIKYLRAVRREEEEESPSRESTPAGRAYSYFEEKCLDCPDDIKIDLIDSSCPGDNDYYVTVYGIDSLRRLQEFLFSKGLRVNFILKSGY